MEGAIALKRIKIHSICTFPAGADRVRAGTSRSTCIKVYKKTSVSQDVDRVPIRCKRVLMEKPKWCDPLKAAAAHFPFICYKYFFTFYIRLSTHYDQAALMVFSQTESRPHPALGLGAQVRGIRSFLQKLVFLSQCKFIARRPVPAIICIFIFVVRNKAIAY